jgi:hypothetical protein
VASRSGPRFHGGIKLARDMKLKKALLRAARRSALPPNGVTVVTILMLLYGWCRQDRTRIEISPLSGNYSRDPLIGLL